MTYDFDQVINRRNSDSCKWDSDHAKDCLPLWVADMDFCVAPAIRQALQHRLDHGIFGYTHVPERYYESIIRWFGHRHGWTIAREHIIYTTGVVPALSAILRARPEHARVVVMTPAYNCFFSSIRNIDCQQIDSPLLCVNNHYEIDWVLLEQQLATADTLLLCNPHNPTGRIWTPDELQRIAEICHEHQVFVISDEIHCEFAFQGQHYTPYATVARDTNYAITIAASKAFNIAGLQCANIVVPDADLRQAIDRAINIHEVCDINPFGMEATIAAYNESEAWLNSLNDYLYANYQWLCDYIAQHLPQWSLTRMEGTYLAWVNVSRTHASSEALAQWIAEQAHVLINPSTMYGCEGYVRINMACPRTILVQAMEAIRSAFDTHL